MCSGTALMIEARTFSLLNPVPILCLARTGAPPMIEDTIGKLEAKIQSAESIKEERRSELAQLLSTLKTEVAALSKTHEEQAQSIAGFAELSTHEATRAEQNPRLLKLSLEGLSSSVEELEKTHPRLVQIVNAISHTLSNLGI
jgi:archaellum component FlaC